MAEAVVSIVVGRLTDLLTEEAQLLRGVRDEIQQVVTELMRMKTFLRDADSRLNEPRVGDLVAQVRDLVYDAEDVIETFLLKASSTERRKIQGGIRNRVKSSVCVHIDYGYHHKFSREIRHIQTRIQNLSNCFGDYDIRSTLEDVNESSSSETPGKLKRFYSYSVVEPDLFVGFQDDLKSLAGHLVNENDDCYPVIFIGGMGGLGKTTLARKIYNHSTIKKHFSGLAWASISQKWQPRDVLQRILISLVHEKKEEIRRMEVDKLVENLLEVQQTKNCLIVLDDIWTDNAWDSLKAAFPTETSKSKLLLTSRNIRVADHVNPKCFIHEPKLLDADQSWELLRLKALPKGDYIHGTARKKMEEWGREMVQNCAGLPLAIIILGGILVTKPTMIEWEKVYYDSRSTLKRGEGLGEVHRREVQETLAWSYNVLPTQLKPCFLYLGKFEEDEEIKAERLYQLLIAEGIVLSSDKSGEESMMEVAESYMGELVYKSMVQVKFEDQDYPQRKFKSFVLHDLMRDLSLSIAKRENFFTVVDFQKLTNFSFNTASSTRQLVVYFDAEGPKPIKENPFFVDKAHQRRVRSVLMIRSLPQKSGLHLANFKFLRVFALGGVDYDEESVASYLQKVLSSLVYLRYLSLEGRKLIFPYIQKLELLKTLKLEAYGSVHFPPWLSRNILSKLGQLQHLYLPSEGIKGLGKNRKLRLNGLSKLETLENFDPEWCEVKDLPKLIRLEKLKVKVRGSKWYDVEEIIKYLSSYSRPPYLTLTITISEHGTENGADTLRRLFGNRNFCLEEVSLQSVLPELRQIFGQQLGNTYIDVSLIRITKLFLWESKLEEDPMAVLEKIPSLRHLELFLEAYMGKEMVCSAMGFPKLTVLELWHLPNLVKWRVEEGSMPLLQHLVISDCRKLEELPEGLRFLNFLDELKLVYMPSDLCDRVRVVNGERGPDFYKVAHVPRLQIEILFSFVMRMKTFLRDADSRLNEPRVGDLVADVREVAYDAEHVVETFLVKSSSTGKAMQWMNKNKFSRKIKGIQRRMSPLFDRFRDCNIKSTLESPSSSSGAPKTLKRFYSYATPEPEIFVGHQDDVDRLVGHLLNESDDSCSLIAICGMGGLGKTTLAQKIYNHTAIKSCFAGLAWATISQKLNRKLVLQRILISLVPQKKDEILTWDYEKLAENLLDIQQRRKCLIVLDDIWSTDAWDSLKAAFPAEKCASKVILTSRNVQVARHVDANGYIYQPECLSEEQSWELLQLKAQLHRQDCLDITRDVQRMEKMGREMVKNCGGLPLAIVILGGILVTKPSLIEWEKVYNDSLFSLKTGNGLGEDYQRELFNVLNWSYNDLPPQLKPCFLYLGKFGEDEWIYKYTVFQLWIVEGLVLSCDKREGETMMQVAESYMGELVHKSLVQVRGNDEEGSLITSFRICSLHDIMRDMSLSQAKVEDFYEVIDLRERNDFDHIPSRSGYGRQLVVQFEEGYTSGKANSYYVKKTNQQRYRSMILLNKSEGGSLPPVLLSHVANFRFLRVFSLEDVELERSTKLVRVIESLVYLRYLSLKDTKFLTFPSIQKLVLLETLRLDTSDDICFPRWLSGNMLLKLGHLRHLYLPYWRNQKFEKNFKLRFDGLSKLETLENFNTDWCVVEDLPKLINLQKLIITTSGYDVEEIIKYLADMRLSSSSDSCLHYLGLTIDSGDQVLAFPNGPDTLRQLLWDQKFNVQELRIIGQLPEMAQIFEQQLDNSLAHVSLVHITTLIVGNSSLGEDPMPVLEKIPSLRQLGLSTNTYMGKEMVCSAMGFPKLTWLALTELPNLVKWRVEEGSMPLLQQLVIRACYKLEELPEGLKLLNSLVELTLFDMPSDLCDRVRVVNGEQGPDFYKVAHISRLTITN